MRFSTAVILLLTLSCSESPDPSPESTTPPAASSESPPSSEGERGAEEVTFETEDGVTLTADVHVANDAVGTPIAILLHQAGGDARGEYGPIIPRLVDHGVNVIAVDLRSGGDRFGGTNRTVAALDGKEYSYCEAAPDVRAALDLPGKLGLEGPVYLWGSSYSAALAINVAAEHSADDVIRVLAFSPAAGGPMEACSPNQNIESSPIPMILFRPENEVSNPAVRAQLESARAAGHETYVMPGGVHGSSMLVDDRATGDTTEAWRRVLAFIDDPDSRH